MASPQFAWTQVYCDPPHYERTMTGFSAIPIASGRFPAGYRIANGQNGGGFPAAGATSDGRSHPIRIQPPISGNGRLTFVTSSKVLIENRTTARVEIACSLGVAHVSGADRPMSPYLGVSHDQDPWSSNLAYVTLEPRQTIQISSFRLDVVDNDFARVDGWPNWRMVPATATRLWPAVSPCLRVRSGAVVVKGVFCHGHVA